MASRKIDYVGSKFQMLLITKEQPKKGKDRIVTCQCDCGTVRDYYLSNIKAGKTTSCGCYRSAAAKTQMTTHGLRQHPNYKAWDGMNQRCYNPNNPGYREAGAMGIGVCDEWKNSITAFINGMGVRPSLKHTLMRIDKNQGYSKANCIWTTSTTAQVLNRRKLTKATSRYKGVYFCSTYNKWVAEIVIDKKKVFLGYFDTEMSAAQKYRTEYKKLHGHEVKYQLRIDKEAL